MSAKRSRRKQTTRAAIRSPRAHGTRPEALKFGFGWEDFGQSQGIPVAQPGMAHWDKVAFKTQLNKIQESTRYSQATTRPSSLISYSSIGRRSDAITIESIMTADRLP